MSVLLTEEAVRAATFALVGPLALDRTMREALAADALEGARHYHATEGREALAQRVAEEIDNVQGKLDADELEAATQAVVTLIAGPEKR